MGPMIAFEYAANTDLTWQYVMPLSELFGMEDPELAVLALRQGHLMTRPDSYDQEVYRVAKVIWRPWGIGKRTVVQETDPWMLGPHLVVILHKVGDDLGDRMVEGLTDSPLLRRLVGA